MEKNESEASVVEAAIHAGEINQILTGNGIIAIRYCPYCGVEIEKP